MVQSKVYGTIICEHCGQPKALTKYDFKAGVLKPGRGRFCSTACHNAHGWKQPAQEHYDEVVDKSGGPTACWPIKGTPNSSGYVQMDTDDRLPNGTYRRIGVHQWALEQKLGRKLIQRSPGKKGEVTRHTCHNSLCGNPDHVGVGSQKDNLMDSSRAGRLVGNPHVRGSSKRWSKLSPQDVQDIKNLTDEGATMAALATTYGVSRGLIWKVLHQ